MMMMYERWKHAGEVML